MATPGRRPAGDGRTTSLRANLARLQEDRMPQQVAKGSAGVRTRSYTVGLGNMQGTPGGGAGVGAGVGFLLGGSMHGGKKRKDVGFDSLKVVNMALVREVTASEE